MKHRFTVLLVLVVLLSSLVGGLMGGHASAKSEPAADLSPTEFLHNFTEALDAGSIADSIEVKVTAGPTQVWDGS